MHIKAFLPHLTKAWERTSKKKKERERERERDGEIGKYKLNEMGALIMELKKWDKLDKSRSYKKVQHIK